MLARTLNFSDFVNFSKEQLGNTTQRSISNGIDYSGTIPAKMASFGLTGGEKKFGPYSSYHVAKFRTRIRTTSFRCRGRMFYSIPQIQAKKDLERFGGRSMPSCQT